MDEGEPSDGGIVAGEPGDDGEGTGGPDAGPAGFGPLGITFTGRAGRAGREETGRGRETTGRRAEVTQVGGAA